MCLVDVPSAWPGERWEAMPPGLCRSIPEDKIVITVNKHGNCSAASIPLALSNLIESKQLIRGDILVFTSFG